MKKLGSPLLFTIIGFALVIWSITSSGSLLAFYDIPAFVITFFGSLAALFISFPIDDMLGLPKIMKELLLSPDENRVGVVSTFVELSRKARQSGLLAIENDLETIDNEMMVHSIQMVVDGKDADTIESIMDLQLDEIEERFSLPAAVFNNWGEFAPAFGMIGTLIGLIIMLGELDDPSTIGSGMSTALITTFYGSMLANIAFIPLASYFERLAEEKMITNEIIVTGTLSLQEGLNPRDLEQKLCSYLTPAEIAQLSSGDVETEMNLGRQEV